MTNQRTPITAWSPYTYKYNKKIRKPSLPENRVSIDKPQNLISYNTKKSQRRRYSDSYITGNIVEVESKDSLDKIKAEVIQLCNTNDVEIPNQELLKAATLDSPFEYCNISSLLDLLNNPDMSSENQKNIAKLLKRFFSMAHNSSKNLIITRLSEVLPGLLKSRDKTLADIWRSLLTDLNNTPSIKFCSKQKFLAILESYDETVFKLNKTAGIIDSKNYVWDPSQSNSDNCNCEDNDSPGLLALQKKLELREAGNCVIRRGTLRVPNLEHRFEESNCAHNQNAKRILFYFTPAAITGLTFFGAGSAIGILYLENAAFLLALGSMLPIVPVCAIGLLAIGLAFLIYAVSEILTTNSTKNALRNDCVGVRVGAR